MINIRKLQENDLKGLVDLYRCFWNETSNIVKMKEKFKEIKDDPRYIFLCAVKDEKVIGSIMGIICDELYGECRPFLLMEDLVVDKEYRKIGIGKALMVELEKFARAAGCIQILFITEANRHESIEFYRSLGFNPHTHIGFKKTLK